MNFQTQQKIDTIKLVQSKQGKFLPYRNIDDLETGFKTELSIKLKQKFYKSLEDDFKKIKQDEPKNQNLSIYYQEAPRWLLDINQQSDKITNDTSQTNSK